MRVPNYQAGRNGRPLIISSASRRDGGIGRHRTFLAESAAVVVGAAPARARVRVRRVGVLMSASASELPPGALVWVRGTAEQPYLPAVVVAATSAQSYSVRCEGTPAPREVSRDTVYERDAEGDRNDNCELLHLNEACVLHNIERRFHARQIYTWTSNVLVALNPYEPVDLYKPELVASLATMGLRELPPHCYSVAEVAYRQMVRLRLSQVRVGRGATRRGGPGYAFGCSGT